MPRSDAQTAILLSTLWLAYLLNMVFRDLHEFVRPGFLDEVMTGTFNGTELTEPMFLLGGIMVNIPIAMVVLSQALRPRAAWIANLAMAPIGLLLIAMSAPGDMDDWLHASIEAALMVAAICTAWRWRLASVNSSLTNPPF